MQVVRPTRIRPDPIWGGFSDWTDDLVFSTAVATPVRFLWKDYKEHCRTWGFKRSTPQQFMRWLRVTEGVRLTKAGPHDENVASGVSIVQQRR